MMPRSGGNGGGVPTTSRAIMCRPTPVFCNTTGTPVYAGGGTSFASSLVLNPMFRLGPQVIPSNTNPDTAGAGYVQVARLG